MEIEDSEVLSSSDEDDFNSLDFESSNFDEEIEILENMSDDQLIPAEEDDLLDMMEEKKDTQAQAIQKLKNHAALKIIRKAKNPRKKNYFFLQGLSNDLKRSPIKLQINSSISSAKIHDEDNVKKSSNLQILSTKTLNRTDETTSHKINKFLTSGDLTIQRFKMLESQIERPKELSLIIKRKIASFDNKKDDTPTKESTSTVKDPSVGNLNQSMTENTISTSKIIPQLLSPESFPKAIVYPDAKKLNVQAQKQTPSNNAMSYNEVFKATAEKIKALENPQLSSKKEKECRSKIHIVRDSNSVKESEKKDDKIDQTPKNFKYLIPQDLLASQDDKLIETNEHKSNNQKNQNSSTTELNLIKTSKEKVNENESLLLERPKINYDLIDALADYRVIARYLFNRLNIPAMDFDATDDYINLYKLSRN